MYFCPSSLLLLPKTSLKLLHMRQSASLKNLWCFGSSNLPSSSFISPTSCSYMRYFGLLGYEYDNKRKIRGSPKLLTLFSLWMILLWRPNNKSKTCNEAKCRSSTSSIPRASHPLVIATWAQMLPSPWPMSTQIIPFFRSTMFSRSSYSQRQRKYNESK